MCAQTTSRRLADRKVERFDKNIMKRGAVPETTAKKGKDYPVGPVLLGFFIFVVIGSCKIFPFLGNFYNYLFKVVNFLLTNLIIEPCNVIIDAFLIILITHLINMSGTE